MASVCRDCNTRHSGPCPMTGAERKGGRPSRRKGQTGSKTGEVLVAAHASNWSMIGEMHPKGSASYVSNWACTVCGLTKMNSSHRSGAKPGNENHPAVYKKK